MKHRWSFCRNAAQYAALFVSIRPTFLLLLFWDNVMIVLPLYWAGVYSLEWNNFPRVTDAPSALPQRGSHHSRMRVLQIKAPSHRQCVRIKDWHRCLHHGCQATMKRGYWRRKNFSFSYNQPLTWNSVSICIPKYHAGKPRQCGWTSALLSCVRRRGDMVVAVQVVKQIRCKDEAQMRRISKHLGSWTTIKVRHITVYSRSTPLESGLYQRRVLLVWNGHLYLKMKEMLMMPTEALRVKPNLFDVDRRTQTGLMPRVQYSACAIMVYAVTGL